MWKKFFFFAATCSPNWWKQFRFSDHQKDHRNTGSESHSNFVTTVTTSDNPSYFLCFLHSTFSNFGYKIKKKNKWINLGQIFSEIFVKQKYVCYRWQNCEGTKSSFFSLRFSPIFNYHHKTVLNCTEKHLISVSVILKQ